MRRLYNHIRFHRNWLLYLWYKINGKIKNGFIFKTRAGIEITVPARLMHTYKECFMDQTYLKGFANTPIRTPTPVVIDIGANVGYFSLNFFCIYPNAQLIAFEPIPNNYQLLQTYQQKNPGLNLTIVNEAVAGKTGELELFFNKADSFSTSATLFKNTHEPDSIIVQTTTLLDIIEQRNLTTVDLLKLDCEGAEYDILYHTPTDVLKKIKAMAIETHTGPGEKENIQALVTYLQTQGYTTQMLRSKIWASLQTAI
jgi:FkbM family methyltransferase